MSHNFVPGIASQSLGNPFQHDIKPKLQAAASVGLKAVEIFYEDINQLAIAYRSNPAVLEPRFRLGNPNGTQSQGTHDQQVLLRCASQIRQWCKEAFAGAPELQIICLQPFMHFEGLFNVEERRGRFEKLYFWIELAKRLDTTLIQIPSNFLPDTECLGNRDVLVEDLREAAKIGAAQTPVIRFAYEALCWGTHINTWDAAWNLVQAVDMPNFGTCLDTFNIAGKVYADPTARDGRNMRADADVAQSIWKLKDVFSNSQHLEKVFYIELCDGEILDAPLNSSHEWYNAEQPSRMTWSRNARLFPFETSEAVASLEGRNKGYLPVTDILNTLLAVGYRGYISFEIFNRSLNKPGQGVIDAHARRAAESWRRCAQHIDAYFDGVHASDIDQNLTLEESDKHHVAIDNTNGMLNFRKDAMYGYRQEDEHGSHGPVLLAIAPRL